MPIPVVRSAIEATRGIYTPDDYSMLQLMAEVGETDPEDRLAVGAYVLFQVYTGSLGYWTYAGNTPFMGLSNLGPFTDFARSIGWTELVSLLEPIGPALQRYTPAQLDAYATFTLDSATHDEIDAITFPETITDLIFADAEQADHGMFRRACEYLEQTVEFLVFDDGAALRAWRADQG